MQKFKDFKPTGFDSHIVIEHIEEWYVLPCGRNRDSNCLEESNFQAAKDLLQETHLSEAAELAGNNDWEELSFNHWACGHFTILVVRPDTEAYKVAQEIEAKLEDYAVLDEDDLSERQYEAANDTWKNCYTNYQRLEYIRDNRSQFDFHDMKDLMQCVRGYHFAGYASELIGE